MQKFLATCALAVLTATAAVAQPAQNLADAAGQKVYDLNNFEVGTISGVTSELGSPYAIVSITNIRHAAGGDYRVLIPRESMQPRSGGGWLAALKSSAIARLYPYVPGRISPG